MRPDYWHLALDIENVQQKFELCATKAASQRTQLSVVKLQNLFTSYRRLKTW